MLTLPLPLLAELPEGAGYTLRRGGARVTATRRGDSLTVEGEGMAAGETVVEVGAAQQSTLTGRSRTENHWDAPAAQEPDHRARDALILGLVIAGAAIFMIAICCLCALAIKDGKKY